MTRNYKKQIGHLQVKSAVTFREIRTEIARATFGVNPSEHKKLKGLVRAKTANLRDHMTDLELIFTMLGEASTTEISKRKDAQGFQQNRSAAREGGRVAGNARKELETKSGRPVVSPENYLGESQAERGEAAILSKTQAVGVRKRQINGSGSGNG